MKRSILCACALVLAACGDFSTTIRDTDLVLTADRTAASVGGDIDFRYEAQGRQLNRLVLDYGDGSAPDSIGLQGAVTATGARTHAYEIPGTFIVSGVLQEVLGGEVSVEIIINVAGSGTP